MQLTRLEQVMGDVLELCAEFGPGVLVLVAEVMTCLDDVILGPWVKRDKLEQKGIYITNMDLFKHSWQPYRHENTIFIFDGCSPRVV
jgi:hypothetical protein